MTSLDQTQRKSRLPVVAATVVAQLAVLLMLCWGLVVYLNWSSAAVMAEFMAVMKPSVAAAEPNAAFPLQSAHHRGAACLRRT
jgi:hypothetical protein